MTTTRPPEAPAGQIDAVLFDFGGVYTVSPFTAAGDLAATLGTTVEVVLPLIFGSYDEDNDHVWHRCERGEVTLADTREAIMAAGQEHGLELDLYHLLAHMGGGAVREPMVERTRALHDAGLRTALVTNNVAEFSAYWRAMLPLDELFDAVVDSSEVRMRKPNPAIFTHALELLGGVDATRAVFVDDFAGNVAAAERLGMGGILVGPEPDSAYDALDVILAGATGTG